MHTLRKYLNCACLLGLMTCLAASTHAATLHSSDFESNDGGWVESGFGDWERGTINFTGSGCDGATYTGPSGAHSGTQAWGTVLNTCYSNSNSTSSLSQTFDLTGYTAASFSWYQFIEVFYSFDTAQLYANGDLLYDRTSTAPTGWDQVSVNLTPYVGGLVLLQFDLRASTVVNRAGWYIDDTLLTATPRGGEVPEPSTTALMFVGAAGLALVRRARKSANL